MLKNETMKVIAIIAFVLFGVFIFIDQAVCALILGALFLGFSLIAISFLRHISKHGLPSVGVLKDIQYDSDGDPHPIVEFTTAEGEVIQGGPFVHTSAHFSRIQLKKTRAHKPLKILYSPEDASKFVIGTRHDFDHFAFFIFGIIGLAMVIFGFCDLFGAIDWFG